MAAVSENRKEYMKRYRENNKEKIKELNRINYMKRKEKLNEEQPAYEGMILTLIESKRYRENSMSKARIKRRKALQESILKDLLASEI